MSLTEFEKEKDLNEKGRMIKKFAKHNTFSNEKQIQVISAYLDHDYYYLRDAATYALFFMWELTDERLINKALEIAINENEDFDVRRWVFSSFPVLYKKTNDKRIPQYTYSVFRFSTNDLVQDSCLRALLQIYGLESRDILLREISNKVHFDKGTIEDRIELFSEELVEIEKMINTLKR
jgi:predicted DNA-binding protein YlxM (UPF0122 family)